MENQPFVSVVTPFYNTAQFLAQCIESVLSQTYQNWEYVLVNNCSTDGSAELAASYASRFPKIRLVHRSSFLSQVENYNYSLSCISPLSKYCKVVQADDWLFPDCVQSMVDVAEAHPSVGIVGAYQLEGDEVQLGGLPFPSPEVPGRLACRLYFLQHRYLFGTPTSLLFRSDLIRSRAPFYEERFAPFEDAHACFDLLKTSNFGFAHRLLTFSRLDNDSILARARTLGLFHLFRLSAVVAHGRDYLSEDDFRCCLKEAERSYFLYLARCALRGRNREFWQLHRDALAAFGYPLGWWPVARRTPRALLEKTWEKFWELCDNHTSDPADPGAESSIAGRSAYVSRSDRLRQSR